MARGKKYHNDHCSSICLGCLKRIKKNPRSLHNNEKLSKLATDHLYPDFLENRLFLPSAFCQTCNDKVISPNPKRLPLVALPRRIRLRHVPFFPKPPVKGS